MFSDWLEMDGLGKVDKCVLVLSQMKRGNTREDSLKD